MTPPPPPISPQPPPPISPHPDLPASECSEPSAHSPESPVTPALKRSASWNSEHSTTSSLTVTTVASAGRTVLGVPALHLLPRSCRVLIGVHCANVVLTIVYTSALSALDGFPPAASAFAAASILVASFAGVFFCISGLSSDNTIEMLAALHTVSVQNLGIVIVLIIGIAAPSDSGLRGILFDAERSAGWRVAAIVVLSVTSVFEVVLVVVTQRAHTLFGWRIAKLYGTSLRKRDDYYQHLWTDVLMKLDGVLSILTAAATLVFFTTALDADWEHGVAYAGALTSPLWSLANAVAVKRELRRLSLALFPLGLLMPLLVVKMLANLAADRNERSLVGAATRYDTVWAAHMYFVMSCFLLVRAALVVQTVRAQHATGKVPRGFSLHSEYEPPRMLLESMTRVELSRSKTFVRGFWVDASLMTVAPTAKRMEDGSFTRLQKDAIQQPPSPDDKRSAMSILLGEDLRPRAEDKPASRVLKRSASDISSRSRVLGRTMSDISDMRAIASSRRGSTGVARGDPASPGPMTRTLQGFLGRFHHDGESSSSLGSASPQKGQQRAHWPSLFISAGRSSAELSADGKSAHSLSRKSSRLSRLSLSRGESCFSPSASTPTEEQRGVLGRAGSSTPEDQPGALNSAASAPQLQTQTPASSVPSAPDFMAKRRARALQLNSQAAVPAAESCVVAPTMVQLTAAQLQTQTPAPSTAPQLQIQTPASSDPPVPDFMAKRRARQMQRNLEATAPAAESRVVAPTKVLLNAAPKVPSQNQVSFMEAQISFIEATDGNGSPGGSTGERLRRSDTKTSILSGACSPSTPSQSPRLSILRDSSRLTAGSAPSGPESAHSGLDSPGGSPASILRRPPPPLLARRSSSMIGSDRASPTLSRKDSTSSDDSEAGPDKPASFRRKTTETSVYNSSRRRSDGTSVGLTRQESRVVLRDALFRGASGQMVREHWGPSRRFFQLSRDMSTLRWSWAEYLLLDEITRVRLAHGQPHVVEVSAKTTILSLRFGGRSEARSWLDTIRRILELTSLGDRDYVMYLLEIFKACDRDHLGVLKAKHWRSALALLNIELDASDEKALLERLGVRDSDWGHTTDFQAFVSLCRRTARIPFVTALFKKYATQRAGGEEPEMSYDGLEQLWRSEMGEPPRAGVRDIFNTAKRPTSGCISQSGFHRILFSAQNGALNPRAAATVNEDMTQPLTHYYISSSHNTFLSGDQYRSNSTLEMYARALLRGCRCVEIDCWDGPGDTPEVFHGYTLTSHLKLRDVLETVNQHAFTSSPYPVILSLEMHLSPSQQLKAASMIREIFGDKLLLPESRRSDEAAFLKSPEELRGRILIKCKIRADKVADTNDEVSTVYETDGSPAASRAPSEGAGSAARTSRASRDRVRRRNSLPGSMSPTVALELLNGSSPASRGRARANTAAPTTPSPRPRRHSISSALTMSSSFLKGRPSTDGGDTSPTRRSGTGADGGTLAFMKRRATLYVRQELSDVTFLYGRGYKLRPDELLCPGDPRDPSEMFSLNESLGDMFLREHANAWMRHNHCQLSRVYPKASRIESSNFAPSPYWDCGVQMVALNIQTFDRSMQLNEAFFSTNGRCGYLLRPPHKRCEAAMNELPHSVLPEKMRLIKVKLIAGLHIVKEKQRRAEREEWQTESCPLLGPMEPSGGTVVSPVVAVEVVGGAFAAAADVIDISSNGDTWASSARHKNGLNPEWGEAFEVGVSDPELAILRFTVWDARQPHLPPPPLASASTASHRFLCSAAVPVSALRNGLRSLPLRDRHGCLIAFSYLLCTFSAQDAPFPPSALELQKTPDVERRLRRGSRSSTDSAAFGGGRRRSFSGVSMKRRNSESVSRRASCSESASRRASSTPDEAAAAALAATRAASPPAGGAARAKSPIMRKLNSFFGSSPRAQRRRNSSPSLEDFGQTSRVRRQSLPTTGSPMASPRSLRSENSNSAPNSATLSRARMSSQLKNRSSPVLASPTIREGTPTAGGASPTIGTPAVSPVGPPPSFELLPALSDDEDGLEDADECIV